MTHKMLALLLLLLAACDCGGGEGDNDAGGGEVDTGVVDTGTPMVRELPRPAVHIDSPSYGQRIDATGLAAKVDVEGTVSADATSVDVKGIIATVANGRFTATDVPLREGDNLIIAHAINAEGGSGTHAISVSVDRTKPHLTITLPIDGEETIEDHATVIGSIVDLVHGADDPPPQVTVNGIPAELGGTEFLAENVPLVDGPNLIRATARDAAGNESSVEINVVRRSPVGQSIVAVSGGGQRGHVGDEIAAPLIVELRSPTGTPIAGRRVSFSVVRGNGLLVNVNASAADIKVASDVNGRAAVSFRRADRSGVAANVIRASAPGFEGKPLFVIGGVPGPADHVVLEDGDNQRGPTREQLPMPVVVKVADDRGNVVSGIPVSFQITRGGGTVDAAMVNSDGDGRARVLWKLGETEGATSDRLEATFAGNTRSPVLVQATGLIPGRVEDTVISGSILSMTQEPIAGIIVRAESPMGAPQSVTTGADGRFAFANVTPGLVTLVLDASGATGGPYPSLSYDLVAIAGRDNRLPRPVYLPALDAAGGVAVSETQGGVLTMRDVDGVSIEILPGSATFLDGSKSGTLTLTQVNTERVPMSPIGGVNPWVVGALQPTGTRFDPPARLRYPNLDGLPPRTVVDVMTFDHDMNRFVVVGTAVVTDDGTAVVSELGQGMPFAGWHFQAQTAPPNTNANGGKCPDMSEVDSLYVRACASGALPQACKDKACPKGTKPMSCSNGSGCTTKNVAGGKIIVLAYNTGSSVTLCPSTFSQNAQCQLNTVFHELLHYCLMTTSTHDECRVNNNCDEVYMKADQEFPCTP